MTRAPAPDAHDGVAGLDDGQVAGRDALRRRPRRRRRRPAPPARRAPPAAAKRPPAARCTSAWNSGDAPATGDATPYPVPTSSRIDDPAVADRRERRPPPACWNDGAASSASSGSATHVCSPASGEATGRASSGVRSEWATPEPGRHPVHAAGLDALHGAGRVAMDHRAVEQVGHRGQADVRVRRHVDADARRQLLGPDEVGEDERADHPPGVERQQPVDLAGADAALARGDDPLDAHPSTVLGPPPARPHGLPDRSLRRLVKGPLQLARGTLSARRPPVPERTAAGQPGRRTRPATSVGRRRRAHAGRRRDERHAVDRRPRPGRLPVRLGRLVRPRRRAATRCS